MSNHWLTGKSRYTKRTFSVGSNHTSLLLIKRIPVMFLDGHPIPAVRSDKNRSPILLQRIYIYYTLLYAGNRSPFFGEKKIEIVPRRTIQCHIPGEVFIFAFRRSFLLRDTKPPYNCARSRGGEYKRTSLSHVSHPSRSSLGYKRWWFSRSTHTEIPSG